MIMADPTTANTVNDSLAPVAGSKIVTESPEDKPAGSATYTCADPLPVLKAVMVLNNVGTGVEMALV